ncbi:MAG TPA: hypothetical protein VK464_05690 [Symbiobacteriaceae bacterium]|jgi:hypothetical protein|nr:hypothetical protein [Symbiobacteriaceae bacterium]
MDRVMVAKTEDIRCGTAVERIEPLDGRFLFNAGKPAGRVQVVVLQQEGMPSMLEGP